VQQLNYLGRSQRFSQLLMLELKESIGDGRRKDSQFSAKIVAEILQINRVTLVNYLRGADVMPMAIYFQVCEIIGLNPHVPVQRAYTKLLDELGPPPTT